MKYSTYAMLIPIVAVYMVVCKGVDRVVDVPVRVTVESVLELLT